MTLSERLIRRSIVLNVQDYFITLSSYVFYSCGRKILREIRTKVIDVEVDRSIADVPIRTNKKCARVL